jgi:glycosyltransferase involved in cell wall biosynthesis
MFEMNARVSLWRKLGFIKKPVVLMYRGSLEDDVLKHLSKTTRIAKKTYDKTLGAAVFKCSDFIISNSKPTLEIIEKKYKIEKNKMSYISNSVNVHEYKKSTQNNKRVLFVGRLIENKGIKFFQKIVEKIPKNWKFTIIGDGPMHSYVEKINQKYKNIEYLGKLPKNEVNKIISKTDILVLPTFAEGSPRVVLEACASGVPSIAFDVGDVKTILNNDENGYIIPKYNIDIFVKKLEELIDDRKLRRKKGEIARIYAENNLDWNVNYQKMINVITKLNKSNKK